MESRVDSGGSEGKKGGRATRETWSDTTARGNMNIMPRGSPMWKKEGEKGNKEGAMQPR